MNSFSFGYRFLPENIIVYKKNYLNLINFMIIEVSSIREKSLTIYVWYKLLTFPC